MNKKAISDQFLRELSNSSEHVRKDRLYYCKKFLDFAPEDFSQWNKELVYNFLNQLKKEEYADGTIRKIYGICKRCFDAAKTVHEQQRAQLISSVNPSEPAAIAEVLKAMALTGPSWDLGKRGAPKVKSSEISQPVLTLADAKIMIQAAKDSGLASHEAAFLVLSTTFGLRRGELCAMRSEYIDYSKGTIFVPTIKGGQERSHLLPAKIAPYLKSHDFNTVFPVFAMSQVYLTIQAKCNIPHQDGGGWHEPRRLLDSLLMDRLPMPQVKTFLRWSLGSSSEMPLHYYHPDLEEADRAVFAVHPLLSLWSSS